MIAMVTEWHMQVENMVEIGMNADAYSKYMAGKSIAKMDDFHTPIVPESPRT